MIVELFRTVPTSQEPSCSYLTVFFLSRRPKHLQNRIPSLCSSPNIPAMAMSGLENFSYINKHTLASRALVAFHCDSHTQHVRVMEPPAPGSMCSSITSHTLSPNPEIHMCASQHYKKTHLSDFVFIYMKVGSMCSIVIETSCCF